MGPVKGWRLALLLSVALLGHSAPCQAELEAHLQRASQLILAGQLEPACAELLLSYQVSHDPVLFLRIGRLQQQLGHNEAARQAYTRFLTESRTPADRQTAKGPHPGLKAEAEQALQALQPPPPVPLAAATQDALGDTEPLPPPPVFATPPSALPLIGPAPAPPAPQGRRRNPRLMKIGGLLFAAGYLPALIIPLALSTSLDHEYAPTPASNYTLLIPVLGPVVSGIVAPATNTAGHGGQIFSSWSAPWILTSGLLQIAGFTLFVSGSLGRGPTL